MLPVLVWTMWEDALFPRVAALGVLMMASLLVVVLVIQIVTRRYGVQQERRV